MNRNRTSSILLVLGTAALAAMVTSSGCGKKKVAAPVGTATDVSSTSTGTLEQIRNGSSSSSGRAPSSVKTGGELVGVDAHGSLQPSTAAPVKPEPVSGCFTFVYHHKPLASHKSDEDCSKHKNLIKLNADAIKAKKLCVKLDGTPVHYARDRKHPDEILIGPIAGPESLITVRYCVGKATCPEDCTVPKDEFMDAIGGGSDDSDMKAAVAANGARWDDGKGSDGVAVDPEIQRELARLDAADDAKGKGAIFAGWIPDDGSSTSSCGKATASAGQSHERAQKRARRKNRI